MVDILTPREYETHPLSNIPRLFPTAATKKFKPSSIVLVEVQRLEATLEALARFAVAADAHWRSPNEMTEQGLLAARVPLVEAGWLP
jgi:hypothetical protein